MVLNYLKNYIDKTIDKHCPEEAMEIEWNLEGLAADLNLIFINSDFTFKSFYEQSRKEIAQLISVEYDKLDSQITTLKSDEELGRQLKRFMLQLIDSNWNKHLDILANKRDGIGLRGYGQEDPYRLFEMEALDDFNLLMENIESAISIRFMEYVKTQYDFGPDEM